MTKPSGHREIFESGDWGGRGGQGHGAQVGAVSGKWPVTLGFMFQTPSNRPLFPESLESTRILMII